MYQAFIGLEIHIQLKSESKIFCACRNSFGDEPNTNICPTCMGLPGTLPVLNGEAMLKSYLLAQALGCELAEECFFERKNYFYPDLPKNYQISQFEQPLGTKGHIYIDIDGQKKRITIRECHLEEDAGKMIHTGDVSLLDYNRTGTPLIEIVTEPDMEKPEEAEILIHELRRIVRYMGLSDGNMEEGSLRADANVSVNHSGQGLGSKVEIKNLNSSRFVKKSLSYEIQRQQSILDSAAPVIQETRLWNENRDQTESMRVKENSNDYRYFPDPDLPRFYADEDFLKTVHAFHVELPLPRRERFIQDYSLTREQAAFLCEERPLADYFETCLKLNADPQQVAVWLASDVQKELNRNAVALFDSPLSPQRLVAILDLLQSGRIHGRIAKQVLTAVFQENKDPVDIIREKNLEQIVDSGEIDTLIQTVMTENPHVLKEQDTTKVRKFLMGKVMQKSSGRVDPRLAQEGLERALTDRAHTDRTEHADRARPERAGSER